MPTKRAKLVCAAPRPFSGVLSPPDMALAGSPPRERRRGDQPCPIQERGLGPQPAFPTLSTAQAIAGTFHFSFSLKATLRQKARSPRKHPGASQDGRGSRFIGSLLPLGVAQFDY